MFFIFISKNFYITPKSKSCAERDDQKRIKNICEVIPEIARQVIIFIKDSDGNIAKNEMFDKIGIEYEVSLKNKEMPVDSKITKVGEF